MSGVMVLVMPDWHQTDIFPIFCSKSRSPYHGCANPKQR